MSDTTGNCCCGNCSLTEAQIIEELEPMLQEYASKPGGVIPALQIAQTRLGYLPEEVIKRIAHLFGKPYSEVAGVVTFYSFFSTVPRGTYLIRVCLGTACYVRGGNELLQALKHKLGIDVGETTADRLFSLGVGRCFGACGMAPVLMVNDDLHQRVKATKVGEILESYRAQAATQAEKEAVKA
jgi:NADH:ubiquinone oxidoreductase subunit E